MATATIGENVRILTCEGEIDPNQYEVMDLQKALVVLRCIETDQMVKVHKSRIFEIMTENDEMSETEIMSTATTTQSDKIANEVASALKQESKEPEKVDFDGMVAEGFEIWTKNNLKFDQSGFEVEAHCVISPDKTEYETFNTYNGSRGKNNAKMKKGEARKRTFFKLADDKALEKKRAALEKKGYVKR